jgi:hypothetical protein
VLARQVVLLLESLHQFFFFMMGFFNIGSPELFSLGWLRTGILQISASCIARMIGVSHQYLVE